MTLSGPVTSDSSKRLLIRGVLVIFSRASGFYGRGGMSGDVVYSSMCYQRSATLLDVFGGLDKILFQQRHSPPQVCSLGFKGEREIIPLNCLSL